MPGAKMNHEDFANYGKDHAVSKDNHQAARFSSFITSEMRPFCFNPKESEAYFRFLTYDLEVFPTHQMEPEEKKSSFSMVKERTLYLYVYKKTEHAEEHAAKAIEYQMQLQEFNAMIAENKNQLAELRAQREDVDRYLDAHRPRAPEPLFEDHIQYTLLDSAGKLVHGKTKLGLTGISPTFTLNQLKRYFAEFKVQIIQEALRADPGPALQSTYEGIPIETQMQWTEARARLVANDSPASQKWVTVPEGSVGLILNQKKPQFIGPGDHIFTAREPGVSFVRIQSLNQMHFAHGDRHVVKVLPGQLIFVQSYVMGSDDYRLLTSMPGVHVFELSDATIVPVNDPFGQDITVTLPSGQKRFLFAKTAQGKGGILVDNPERLVMLSPGVTQISPIARFFGRISTKNSLLTLSIKEVKDKSGRLLNVDKDGVPLHIEAVLQYRLIKPYNAIQDFCRETSYAGKLTINPDNISKLIKQEATKELVKQINSFISIRGMALKKVDYSFYEGVIVREVLTALNERLVLETKTKINGVIQSLLVTLKKSTAESLIGYVDDGYHDSTIINRLKRIVSQGQFDSNKVEELVPDLKTLARLEPEVRYVRDRYQAVQQWELDTNKDVIAQINSTIEDLRKPLNKALITSLIDTLSNGILNPETLKSLYKKLNQPNITREVVLSIIDDLRQVEGIAHTVVSKLTITTLKPSDPRMVDELENASAQAITQHSNDHVKTSMVGNEKMDLMLKAQQQEIERLKRDSEELSKAGAALLANTKMEVAKMLEGTPGAAQIYAASLPLVSQNKDTFFYPQDEAAEQSLLSFQLGS